MQCAVGSPDSNLSAGNSNHGDGGGGVARPGGNLKSRKRIISSDADMKGGHGESRVCLPLARRYDNELL